MIDRYAQMIDKFPIRSIEDGLGETDTAGWRKLTARLGQRVQLVGDDNFVTNPDLIASAVTAGIGNAALIKVNQVGTVSETLDALRVCRDIRLRRNDLASVGRDRRHVHRRPRRRFGMRPDQVRCTGARGTRREIQPASRNRGLGPQAAVRVDALTTARTDDSNRTGPGGQLRRRVTVLGAPLAEHRRLIMWVTTWHERTRTDQERVG